MGYLVHSFFYGVSIIFLTSSFTCNAAIGLILNLLSFQYASVIILLHTFYILIHINNLQLYEILCMLLIRYIFERNVFKNATLGEVQRVSPHCLDSEENANIV